MTASRHLVRAAGLFLLVAPFLPIERLTGPLGERVLRPVPAGEWALGIFVFVATGWLLARLVPALPARVADAWRRVSGAERPRRHARLAVLAVLAGLLVLVSAVVFRHRPIFVDSIVQVFQANIFASGRLTAPVPAAEAFVATQHMLMGDGGWFAQYPPGHAALLALGAFARLTWVVPVLLSLGSALLLQRFARRAWDEQTGLAVLGLALLAPFFWIMGASFMNHVTCLFFVALFLVLFRSWEETGGAGRAFAAGLAIGAAGLARPLTALAVAAVFAPIGLAVAARERRAASVGAAAAGGLLAGAAFLAWNALTTGDPLLPGYLAQWGSSHGVGFHVSPWGQAHTPATGLQNELLDLAHLSEFLLEWPIPALLPAGLYLALTGGRGAWDRRLAAAALAIPGAYLFYWHRDAFLGPRFLYASLAFFLPLTARALLAVRDLPAGRLRLRRTVGLAVLLCFAYTVLYAAPRRVANYASSMESMKVDLPALAREAGIERGVVFVAVSWGNRLLTRMRAAGAGASLTETVYRRADHCEIELLLRRARDERWSGARTAAALAALPEAGVTLRRASPNGDTTLRLVPGRPLAPACREELAHDTQGYGNWLPFLLANDPALENPVLYVRDLRDLNPRFLNAYPGRPAWLYRPSGFTPLPR